MANTDCGIDADGIDNAIVTEKDRMQADFFWIEAIAHGQDGHDEVVAKIAQVLANNRARVERNIPDQTAIDQDAADQAEIAREHDLAQEYALKTGHPVGA